MPADWAQFLLTISDSSELMSAQAHPISVDAFWKGVSKTHQACGFQAFGNVQLLCHCILAQGILRRILHAMSQEGVSQVWMNWMNHYCRRWG